MIHAGVLRIIESRTAYVGCFAEMSHESSLDAIHLVYELLEEFTTRQGVACSWIVTSWAYVASFQRPEDARLTGRRWSEYGRVGEGIATNTPTLSIGSSGRRLSRGPYPVIDLDDLTSNCVVTERQAPLDSHASDSFELEKSKQVGTASTVKH